MLQADIQNDLFLIDHWTEYSQSESGTKRASERETFDSFGIYMYGI